MVSRYVGVVDIPQGILFLLFGNFFVAPVFKVFDTEKPLLGPSWLFLANTFLTIDLRNPFYITDSFDASIRVWRHSYGCLILTRL